jgi:FG-GAP-like repeat
MAFVMRRTATGAAALIASLLLSATGAAGTAPVEASFAPGPSLPAGPTPSAVAVADFDKNGSPDLAISNDGYHSNLRILLNDGSGEFRTAPGSPFRVKDAGSVAAGDFNGDGKQDLAAATGDGVVTLLGNGGGGLTAAATPPAVLPGYADWLAAPGDLNGDGNADLVAVDHENGGFKIRILLGNGMGGFTVSPQTPPVTVKGDPDEYVSLQVQIADFNGDGKLDLVAAGTANVWILLNDGTARFALASGSPFKVKAGIYSFVQGDFNGDGKPDLGAQGWSKGSDWPSVISILLNDGAGTLHLAHAAYRIGTGDRLISADFNGDGRPDLALTAGEYDEFISLLLGTASGFRQAQFTPTVADTTGPLATADFNGDGKLDILALSWGVSWWPDSPRKDAILFQTTAAPAIAAGRSLPASADKVYSAHGRGGIYGLAADGKRAAICDSGVPVVWTPGRKAVAFRRKSYDGDYGCYSEIALGGGKVAWMEQGCGNTSCDTDVFAAQLPNGRPRVVEGGIENYCGAGPCDLSGDWAGQLIGAGPILVHDLWSVDCILPPPPPDCDEYGTCPDGCSEGNSTLRDFGQGLERLAPGRGAFLPGRFPVRAVGGGRIAVEPAGKILVLRANGSPLSTVAETDPVRGVALSASELAVLRTSTLDLYAPTTGAKKKSIPLGPAAALQLSGVTSKLALLYGQRGFVLVRLSDAKLISVPLRSQAIGRLVDAKLTASGLFYAYNIPGKKGRQSGRVVFEPTARLLARF